MTVDDTDSPGRRRTPDEFVTAGRFGSLTLLSAKALRLYAERGLLPPHHVDPANGYRYYAPAQVRTGWLIALLRSAGLPLEAISRIVHADPEAGLRHLERAAAAVERRSATTQTVLNRARSHLRHEEHPMSQVRTALEFDRPVLSVLRTMRPQHMGTVITAEVAGLREVAATRGLAQAGEPFGIFHAPVTDESDGPLEIVLPTDGLTDLAGDVRSYRFPGGLVALRYAEGAETWFPDILALYDEVYAWLTDAGRVPVGPPREIWHNGPSDPGPLRLTVAWPYAPALD